MSTQNALSLPGPLISQIETAAEAEHVTPEQFVQNLLAKHLEPPSPPKIYIINPV